MAELAIVIVFSILAAALICPIIAMLIDAVIVRLRDIAKLFRSRAS